jgi:hypothetical protein
MQPESSLQCSQEHATGPYSEVHETSPHPYTLIKIHFNIILHI